MSISELPGKLSPLYLWAHGVLAAGIKGATTAFLVVSGGSTLSQTADLPSIGLKTLALTVAMGFAVGAANELNRNPLPDWSATTNKGNPTP